MPSPLPAVPSAATSYYDDRNDDGDGKKARLHDGAKGEVVYPPAQSYEVSSSSSSPYPYHDANTAAAAATDPLPPNIAQPEGDDDGGGGYRNHHHDHNNRGPTTWE